MNELDVLKRKIERERLARKQAESILEQKSLELFEVNARLTKFNEELETLVELRSAQLLSSEMRYRSMIENMELGILEVDNHGFISEAHDRFCTMTGYTREELIGQNAKDLLLVPEFEPVMKLQHDQRQRGNAGSYEIKLRRKDGSEAWVLISGAPFYDENGDISGTAGIHYDITERKELENDLRVARVQAEKAQRAEHEFLANMSHEMRTPLNSIIGMTQMLLSGELSEEQQNITGIISHSSQLLLSLINDILDVSKLDAGSVSVQTDEFDLTELLENIRSTFAIKSREKDIQVGLNITGEPLTYVKGDSMLLNQILMNLVGNAEKFTDHGNLDIEANVETLPNKHLVSITVRDTGVGIPAEQLPFIFDKFHQVTRTSTKRHGGTGLGLAITHKILNILGSEIKVLSEPGKGSEFSFTLESSITDRHINPTTRDITNWSVATNVQQRKVLVAEDNELNQRYIDMLFKKVGMAYRIVSNGQEAIDQCQTESFDLILMDIQMPDVDGLQASTAIRKSGINTTTPIVALSAMTLNGYRELLDEAGIDDYLPKPFTPKEFYAMIGYYLGDRDGMNSGSEETDPVSQPFQFSDELDQAILWDSYGDDLDYALDIFLTFRQNIEGEMIYLKSLRNEADLPKLYRVLHRLKPTFQMVGLPELTQHFRQAEQQAMNGNLAVLDELELLCDLVKRQLPLIDREIERMNHALYPQYAA